MLLKIYILIEILFIIRTVFVKLSLLKLSCKKSIENNLLESF